MKLQQAVHWGCAVGVALLVAACGGGSGSAPEPAPAAVPDLPAADRIEPFDPSLVRALKAATSAVAAPPAAARAPLATTVRLGPLAASQLRSLQRAATPLAGKAMRQHIGLARDLAATATAPGLRGQLQWLPTERGTQHAAIRFEAQGALGVRLGLVVRALPPGSTLRFYAQAGAAVVELSGQDVLRTIARNLQAGDTGDAARTYWSPDFGGADTTLELELPASADLAQLDIAVPTLSHFFVPPDAAAQPGSPAAGAAGSCNVDLSCRPDFSSESRSVARMLFVENGHTFLCTGTLLNDAQSSTTPYFLSASHCVSTQSAASSLTTDWFFRSSACNSGEVYAGAQRLNGGATLLYAQAATDTAFMRLNAAPPAGIVFAGSYFGAVAQGAGLAGIHHPQGDLQKVSEGSVTQFDNCTLQSCLPGTPQDGRFLNVGWRLGTVESGSSGSGLFLPIGSKRYVVGQLMGGAASCQNPGGANYYGRFDLAFQAALRNWLKPVQGAPTGQVLQ